MQYAGKFIKNIVKYCIWLTMLFLGFISGKQIRFPRKWAKTSKSPGSLTNTRCFAWAHWTFSFRQATIESMRHGQAAAISTSQCRWGPSRQWQSRSCQRRARVLVSSRSSKEFSIILFKFTIFWSVPHIAFGRIWQHGKYCYSVAVICIQFWDFSKKVQSREV